MARTAYFESAARLHTEQKRHLEKTLVLPGKTLLAIERDYIKNFLEMRPFEKFITTYWVGLEGETSAAPESYLIQSLLILKGAISEHTALTTAKGKD